MLFYWFVVLSSLALLFAAIMRTRRNLLAAFDDCMSIDDECVGSNFFDPTHSPKRSLLPAFDAVADTPVPPTATTTAAPAVKPPAVKRRRKLLKVSNAQ